MSVLSELTRDEDEETVNLASATVTFSSCAHLYGLKRKGVILCGFKATCSLVNMGLTPLVFVRLSAFFIQMEFNTMSLILMSGREMRFQVPPKAFRFDGRITQQTRR